MKTKKIKESLIEKMFAEIMPEVRFVDVVLEAGGDIAGGARKKLEKKLDRSVVTSKNFLKSRENKKRLKNGSI